MVHLVDDLPRAGASHVVGWRYLAATTSRNRTPAIGARVRDRCTSVAAPPRLTGGELGEEQNPMVLECSW